MVPSATRLLSVRIALIYCASLLACNAPTLFAADTADIKSWSGWRPVQLWPRPNETDKRPELSPPIDIGKWTYRAVKSLSPRDGVPWELIVTPAAHNIDGWQIRGSGREAIPVVVVERKKIGEKVEKKNRPDALPVVELPETLWKNWMAPDMKDVVGIHFHEMVSDDTARILFTLHKVPPDNPDGSAPAAGNDAGQAGTRIEATLLAPVTYSLDQSIAVRVDPLKKDLADSRGKHEMGHADLAFKVFLAVLQGPQDWNPRYCTGRRSRIEYYWKREQIGRSWGGYRDGAAKLAALRTSIVLVPPTRWSMLLPIPPERVTQKHLQAFNDAIVLLGPQFSETDRVAQAKFHAQHGAFEQGANP